MCYALIFPKFILLESASHVISWADDDKFFKQKRELFQSIYLRVQDEDSHRDCRRLFSARPAIVLSSWRAQLILAPGTLHSVAEAW